jgi:hypothetical protein
MRAFIVAVTAFALISQGGLAFGQQSKKRTAVRSVRVEKVLDANPEPDGKAYRIELLLSKGKHVAYQISPSQAAKIADGLSKPAAAGGRKKKVATLVYGMTIEVDSQGQAVVLMPRGRTGPLEALAIPTNGAEKLVEVLRAKVAEAKASAAKQPARPK